MLSKNGTRHKGIKTVHRLRIQAHEKKNGQIWSDTSWTKARSKKLKKKASKSYKKGEDCNRVTKKNAASNKSVYKYSKTIDSAARTAEKTRVEEDVVEKTGLMVDVASSPKTLAIRCRARASTAKKRGEDEHRRCDRRETASRNDQP